MGERVVLDRLARCSRSASNSGSASTAFARLSMKPARTLPQRPLQLRVGERAVRRSALNAGERDLHARLSSRLSADRRRRRSCRPALRRHGAPRWREPSRFSLPAMFIRQPRSPASSMSAPAVFDVGGLLRHDRVGDVGIFDAERAAEAAADFRVLHFGELQPLDRGEQPARLARGCRVRAGPSRNRDRSRVPCELGVDAARPPCTSARKLTSSWTFAENVRARGFPRPDRPRTVRDSAS